MFRNRSVRVVVVVWALMLGFGISYSLAAQTSLHGGCFDQCEDDCGTGQCESVITSGCDCFWRCSGGGGGHSICV